MSLRLGKKTCELCLERILPFLSEVATVSKLSEMHRDPIDVILSSSEPVEIRADLDAGPFTFGFQVFESRDYFRFEQFEFLYVTVDGVDHESRCAPARRIPVAAFRTYEQG